MLTDLLSGKSLSAEQSEVVLGQVLSGNAAPSQIAALATALRAKGESVGEMTGFVRAMVAHAVPLDLPAGIELVDTCGTGGDRLRSINVSTIAALVVGATGAKVCKHGGRASSSAVGAADVLEALGVVVDLGPERSGPVYRRSGHGLLLRPAVPSCDAVRGARPQGVGYPDRLQLPRSAGQPGPGPLPGGRGE